MKIAATRFMQLDTDKKITRLHVTRIDDGLPTFCLLLKQTDLC